MPHIPGIGFVPAGNFTQNRTTVGLGYAFDWNGDVIVTALLEAGRRAIDDVNHDALIVARDHPLWDNDTGQTEDALFRQPARIELDANGGPLAWGMWGVEDRPRFQKEEGDDGSVLNPSPLYRERYTETYGHDEFARPKMLTTVDVALFLEFGTVNMEARPWLYPAWDATKHTLPLRVREHYATIAMGGALGIRNPLGQFQRYKGLL